MFLIFGIDRGQKRLKFGQAIVCPCCGKYGRLDVFSVYTFFSLFFIPIIKWDKNYSAKTSCCSTVYSVPTDLGNSIESGESVILRPEDLQIISNGRTNRVCCACGYGTDDADFRFCPACGSRLED